MKLPDIPKYRERVTSMASAYAHWARYGIPNPFPSRELSPRAQPWLTALRRDGIVRIECPRIKKNVSDFLKVLPHLVEDPRLAQDALTDDMRSFGVRTCYSLSFRILPVKALCLDPDLLDLAHTYLRRRPLFRNPPIYQTLEFKRGMDPTCGHGSRFHNDALQQLSWMFLLSDATPASPHLTYVRGSHRRALGTRGMHLALDDAERLAHRGEAVPAVGPQGTLYVFDAFGIHRRILHPGSRKILHCNLNTGHWPRPFWEDLSEIPELSPWLP